MRKLICAIALVFATHAFSQQARAEFYWDPNGARPVLYFFTVDKQTGRGIGDRHIYTTGNLSFSQHFPFTWVRQGNLLTIQDTINGTDQFRLGGYNAALDILPRTGIGQAVRWGPGFWYGCRSAEMPVLIRIAACPAPLMNRGLSE
jgi:hypothetical protein